MRCEFIFFIFLKLYHLSVPELTIVKTFARCSHAKHIIWVYIVCHCICFLHLCQGMFNPSKQCRSWLEIRHWWNIQIVFCMGWCRRCLDTIYMCSIFHPSFSLMWFITFVSNKIVQNCLPTLLIMCLYWSLPLSCWINKHGTFTSVFQSIQLLDFS